MDLVVVRRLDALLRRLLRRRAGFDSLDDHRRALLPGPASGCHVRRCSHQLVSGLLSEFRNFHLKISQPLQQLSNFSEPTSY